MRTLLTAITLLISSGCFSQSEMTSLRTVPRHTGRFYDCFSQSNSLLISCRDTSPPINYATLANFDFENQLKFDYSQIQDKPAKPKVAVTAELLCGHWQAEAMGNDWVGLNQKLVRPNKQMVFEGDSVFIFQDNQLLRKTSFHLKSPEHNRTAFSSLLELNDSSERWAVSIIDIGERVPWHGRATKVHLLFNKKLNCACGCPEELYSMEPLSEAADY